VGGFQAPVLKFDYGCPALSRLVSRRALFKRLAQGVLPSRRASFHPVAGRLGPKLGPLGASGAWYEYRVKASARRERLNGQETAETGAARDYTGAIRSVGRIAQSHTARANILGLC
jgi:hypothetical protein